MLPRAPPLCSAGAPADPAPVPPQELTAKAVQKVPVAVRLGSLQALSTLAAALRTQLAGAYGAA